MTSNSEIPKVRDWQKVTAKIGTVNAPSGTGKAGNLKQYVCEFCGIYTATKPRCNKCEEER